jgi:hypothetical protein
MERKIQLDLRLKLNALRDTSGFVESIAAEMYWDGMTVESDDRLISVSLYIPVSLWETPHIDVDVKTALQQMLNDIRGAALEQNVQ